MTPTLRRRVLFAALYFSEGAPIGFLWWALPTRLRAAGVEVAAITTLLGVLVLPWALKFLGAPLMDILRTPRWPLRAWIASCQIVMGLCLLATLAFDWRADFAAIGALLLLHAVFAASQDVAVDAYALQIVRPEHRGAINAWMQGGMLAGRAIFGGGALLLDARVGATTTILLLVAAIWSSLLVLAVAGEPEVFPQAGTTVAARRREFLSALGAALRRRSTWLILAFATIGGAGFEAVGLLVGPYLLERGFSQSAIGGFLFLPTVLAMLAGAAAAGVLADRVDRRAGVAMTLVATAATIAVMGSSPALSGEVVLALLALLYFLIGALTTASYALFMDFTDPRLGATQLSAAMSATNLCESWSAFAVGRLTTMLGFGAAFSWMAAVSLLALPCLWWLPKPEEQDTRCV